ncbi:MAG: hypothetical protein EPO26_15155 [Chloroflexota bacterium]|nr:MAG: hypothetical protein EPO26_15155 [Chloroflexota bacterium]
MRRKAGAALARPIVVPGQRLQRRVARGGLWAAFLHPSGLALAFVSVGLASAIVAVPALSEWSGRVPWLLGSGLASYVACVGVVSLWPTSLPGIRGVRQTRRRVASGLSLRIDSSSLTARAELDVLRSAALSQIDDLIVPPFTQLVQRDAGIQSEIRFYERSSLRPNPEVVIRLQTIQAHCVEATRRCAQRAIDAEARLYALLQDRDERAFISALDSWVADLGHLATEVAGALTLPPWDVQTLTSEPRVRGSTPMNRGIAERMPSGFVESTRHALRALNKPGLLMKSDLVRLLPESLAEVRRRSAAPGRSTGSPLEQGQILRALLVGAIERLNVPSNEELTAYQFQVLRMQYVMGLTVVQVGVRLSIAEKTVFRRSKEGVEAVANDIWCREQVARTEAVAEDNESRA